ncbi:hypothetical protein WMY93_034112 [Mugilogobius chulae]|uniref:Uncharacterized protein n=1 Tax=Mugilogobius chulae TaxID=88201 RepID=A0AAW0MGY3_9GOBI
MISSCMHQNLHHQITPPGSTAQDLHHQIYSTRIYTPGSTPPGSTPPGSTPPGSTAPGSTPPGSTPPGSTPPGSTAPGSTPPGSTPPGSTAPGSTPPGSTARIYTTRIYSTRIYTTRIYTTRIYTTRIYTARIYSTRIYTTRIYTTRIYTTRIYTTRIYTTRIYSTRIYTTRIYTTRIYSTRIYTTRVYTTRIYSTRIYSTRIYTTRIYSSDIGMSFGLEKCSRMVTKRRKEKIQTTDVKTRKLLTMHGGFHPKSSTLRLYASRKEGGRGLVSVRATIQDETSEIHKYIKDKAPTDGVLSECLRQWGTDEVLEEEPSWEDKPLHGMYHRNITEVADLKKSYQWLERAGLKDSTEALILAAQEQALSTRAIEAQIYHTRQDPRCRRKEHEKLEKYQGLREELEKAWKVKATVVPVVIGALGAVTPKLDEWLQHIPGSTPDISVQKSAVLGTARILRRTLKLPGLW